MWRTLWRLLVRSVREERGAVVIWWWGAETANDVLAAFGLVAFATAVFAHERAVLFLSPAGAKPKGAKFSFGIKTLVP